MTATLSPKFIITVDDDDDDNKLSDHCVMLSPTPQSPTPTDPDVQFVCKATLSHSLTDYSDIEVVCQRRAKDKHSLATCDTADPNDDVSIVGQRTMLDTISFYPHFHFMCAQYTPCDKCYCFVCDIPHNQCLTWDLHRVAADTPRWQNARAETLKLRHRPDDPHHPQPLYDSRTFGTDRTNTP